jgi:hypothetical protein
MLEIAGNSSCINSNTRWKLSGQIKYLLLDTKETVGCNEVVVWEDGAGINWFQIKAVYFTASFTPNFLTRQNII